MVAWRRRPKGARRRSPFGLTTILAILMPTSIGFQDLAALMARQPDVSQRWREHVRISSFGTFHAATFSFPRPLGTAIPPSPGFVLANFDPRSLDTTGVLPGAGIVTPETLPPLVFPSVNRALKGDILAPRPRPQPEPQDQPSSPRKKKEKDRDHAQSEPPPFDDASPGPVGGYDPRPDMPVAAPEHVPIIALLRLPLDPRPDVALVSPAHDRALVAARAADPSPEARPPALDPRPDMQVVSLPAEPDGSDVVAVAPANPTDPSTRVSKLFFGDHSLGTPVAIQPWADGAQPVVVAPRDSDIKLSALAPEPPRSSGTSEGETVANKGEVTGEGKRPKTPAERLGLSAPARAKAEKCLADAVYYESRGEPERGQMAVAQVVMNRVFSPYYPPTVCGVVYQNAHRYLACQFTFACEGKKLIVNEPDMWEQAQRIARDTLDGKIWLPEVGKSTHYHAYWVRPGWVREMKKLWKFGVHTFYRPTAWGDGADEPAWGEGAKLSLEEDDEAMITSATPVPVPPSAKPTAAMTDSIAKARM